MALKFSCPKCSQLIIVKYLKPGEMAKCLKCGDAVLVPADAVVTDEYPTFEKPIIEPPEKKGVCKMRKIEIHRVGVLSAWKVVAYIMALPAVIFFLIGIIAMVIGIFTGQNKTILIGLLMATIYPIILIVIYGLMAMLMTLIYNLLAGRFGGLEMTIKEEEPAPVQDKTVNIG